MEKLAKILFLMNCIFFYFQVKKLKQPIVYQGYDEEIEFCKRSPNVLILGVKKCGTTTLGTFLNHHPNIVTTGEVPFFENNKTYAKGYENYIKKMPVARFHYCQAQVRSPKVKTKGTWADTIITRE